MSEPEENYATDDEIGTLKQPPPAPTKPSHATTPAATAAPVPAPVTAPETPACKKSNIFVFEMKRGKHFKFEGEEQANAFQKQYAIVIKKRHAYVSLASAEKKFKALTEGTTNTTTAAQAPARNRANTAVDNVDNDAVRRLFDDIRSNQDAERLEVHWLTTDTAELVLLLLKPVDRFQGDPWYFKCINYINIFKRWFQIYKCPDKTIEKAFNNLGTSPRSCDTDPERKQILAEEYKDKRGMTRQNEIHLYHTFVPIPTDTLNSTDEETDWIKNLAEKVGNTMLEIMKKPDFRSLLSRLDKDRSSKLSDTIFNEKKGTNLPKYLREAAVCVKPINGNLQDLVPANIQLDMMHDLLTSSTTTAKYQG
ncbi:hypothetical protein SEMRO_654_G182000.1 [Seminavis robusta]|uniref:Uncharacterized protein n=1 Tax=Seminavis robusta TaxID=568900 RepID=A0A9N8E9E4_9STRA|nr:hypothetical protein SEMRO_654_G182000.1 [Seminavis robusta]|eukprot:Sro654_g182000.1 n/a (365) ;mRNA; f:9564-10658